MKFNGEEKNRAGLVARIFLSILLAGLGYYISLGNAYAVASGVTITFEGKGAGRVFFSGTVHAAKGLSCADCHESHGFSPALFAMERGDDTISMRKIEMGRSCGYCHEITPGDTLVCSKCHKNK